MFKVTANASGSCKQNDTNGVCLYANDTGQIIISWKYMQ